MEIAESTWRTAPITIDGIDDGIEWEHAKYLFEEEQVTLGLVNDADRLYVYFSTGNTSLQRQIINGGVTLWIDPTGSDEKRLGIRYPSRVRGERLPVSDRMERGSQRQPAAGRPGTVDLAAQMERLPQVAELIGFDTVDSTHVSCAELSEMGISIALGQAPGVLIFELSLPLDSTGETPFDFDITGDAFSMCLETTANEMSGGMASGPMGGGGPGGGMPGGMGGGMGGMSGGGQRGMGGGPGGRMPQIQDISEPIERWITVELATQ